MEAEVSRYPTHLAGQRSPDFSDFHGMTPSDPALRVDPANGKPVITMRGRLQDCAAQHDHFRCSDEIEINVDKKSLMPRLYV
jgi:hypothetical protein